MNTHLQAIRHRLAEDGAPVLLIRYSQTKHLWLQQPSPREYLKNVNGVRPLLAEST